MTMGTLADPFRPETAAALTRARDTSGLAGAWFEACTDAGPMRLCTPGAARHAADAAIALARIDRLLDALDQWLGTGLDWRWMAGPVTVTPSASHARVQWRDGDNVATADDSATACRLELPWTLLRLLPAPPEALAHRLHWLEVGVVLAVSQPRLGVDELAMLEPGGAVLLPESMQASWRGMVRSTDEPADKGVPVALPSPATPRRIAAFGAPAATADENRLLCEVRLAVPRTVPGDRLAGWYDGDLPTAGPRAELWQLAVGHEPARRLACGPLMPWGDGWAFAVQDVSTPVGPDAPVGEPQTVSLEADAGRATGTDAGTDTTNPVPAIAPELLGLIGPLVLDPAAEEAQPSELETEQQ